jgi:uncharacterized protein YuzE
MAKNKIHALRISYDKTADILYLAFGTPKEGIDEEVSPGVFVRMDERTKRASGMTIVDFEKRFSSPLGESLPIDLAEYLLAA